MAAGSAGNRVNKGQSSGPSNGGSTHEARMFLTPSLYKIAKSLPPNKRVEMVEKKPSKLPKNAMSDQEIMQMIRMHKEGMTFVELSEFTGKNESWIRNICQGANRGHLLRMVEEGHSDYRMGWKHKK